MKFALLAVAGWLLVLPAAAETPTFLESAGDWQLRCWTDATAKSELCNLFTVGQYDAGAGTTEVLIGVAETATNDFLVLFGPTDELIDRFAPLMLRVDRRPEHVLHGPHNLDRASWHGAAADKLVHEFIGGRAAVIRFAAAQAGRARAVHFSLMGFTKAFNLYRRYIRDRQLLAR